MKSVGRLFGAGLLLSAMLALSACPGDDDSTGATACDDGVTQTCNCSDGAVGTQVCANGNFPACVCIAGDAGLDMSSFDTGAGDAGRPDAPRPDGSIGDDTGNVGDDTGDVGDDTGNVGDDTGNVGDDTGNVGDDASDMSMDAACCPNTIPDSHCEGGVLTVYSCDLEMCGVLPEVTHCPFGCRPPIPDGPAGCAAIAFNDTNDEAQHHIWALGYGDALAAGPEMSNVSWRPLEVGTMRPVWAATVRAAENTEETALGVWGINNAIEVVELCGVQPRSRGLAEELEHLQFAAGGWSRREGESNWRLNLSRRVHWQLGDTVYGESVDLLFQPTQEICLAPTDACARNLLANNASYQRLYTSNGFAEGYFVMDEGPFSIGAGGESFRSTRWSESEDLTICEDLEGSTVFYGVQRSGFLSDTLRLDAMHYLHTNEGSGGGLKGATYSFLACHPLSPDGSLDPAIRADLADVGLHIVEFNFDGSVVIGTDEDRTGYWAYRMTPDGPQPWPEAENNNVAALVGFEDGITRPYIQRWQPLGDPGPTSCTPE